MSPDLTSVWKRRADVRYRRVEGEAVVLRQSAAEVLVVNEIGAAVLDLADGARRISDWVDALDGEYDVDKETLTRDLLEFAAELEHAGLLERVE
jgi:hypothetical protein